MFMHDEALAHLPTAVRHILNTTYLTRCIYYTWRICDLAFTFARYKPTRLLLMGTHESIRLRDAFGQREKSLRYQESSLQERRIRTDNRNLCVQQSFIRECELCNRHTWPPIRAPTLSFF